MPVRQYFHLLKVKPSFLSFFKYKAVNYFRHLKYLLRVLLFVTAVAAGYIKVFE